MKEKIRELIIEKMSAGQRRAMFAKLNAGKRKGPFGLKKGEAGAMGSWNDPEGLADSFGAAAKKFGVKMKLDPRAEGYGDFHSYLLKKGGKQVAAFGEDAGELATSFQGALKKLGLNVRRHPKFEGSDTHGFVISKKKKAKKK